MLFHLFHHFRRKKERERCEIAEIARKETTEGKMETFNGQIMFEFDGHSVSNGGICQLNFSLTSHSSNSLSF
jgi:hypothetical protein